MKRFKGLLVAAVLMILGASVFAAEATVTYVSGKVEVQRGGKWVALNKGDTVSKSETISTGFQSEAKIKMMNNSVMYLGPVTRITLEELSTTGQQDNVNVYLKTGAARSQVKHVDNKRVNYQVHTAVAVASCRGTDWIIDDSNNIICFDGIVAVAAYEPPADSYVDGQDVDGEKSEKEEGESTEESSTESSSEEKSEDTSSAKTDSKTTTVTEKPTTSDGILVKANQSVTVSVTSEVSVPVNTVVTVVSNVTSAVKTAAAKEAVASVETNEAPPAVAADEPKSEPTTGNVVVNIELE